VTVNDANFAGHGVKIKLTLSSNLILYPYFFIFEEPASDDMRWEFKEIKGADNGESEVYVLSYEYKENGRSKERGLVYVCAEDLGILRIDRETTTSGQKVRDLETSPIKYVSTYQYQRLPGTEKYILHYSRTQFSFSLSSNGVNNDYTLTTDFLVTDTKSNQKNIRARSDRDPFEVEKNSIIVEQSDLRVIPPDYK
jgi:hypothetical protein